MINTTTCLNCLQWIMRGMVILSIVSFILINDFMAAVSAILILILIIAPSIFKKYYTEYFPFELEFFTSAFIFLTLFLGSLRGYYEKFHWWDDVLHFKSGLLLGIAGFILIYVLNHTKSGKIRMTPGFISLFAVCFSLALSVVWEIYEYFADTFFGYTMQGVGVSDTMNDFISNGFGSIIVASLGYAWMRKRKKIPFSPAILGNINHESKKELH